MNKLQTQKVRNDAATRNSGNVRLGDAAPVFGPAIRRGGKVSNAPQVENTGNVKLGDAAPSFRK